MGLPIPIPAPPPSPSAPLSHSLALALVQDVVITGLVPGGPAERDGRLHQGDVVTMIGGAPIGGHPSVQVTRADSDGPTSRGAAD